MRRARRHVPHRVQDLVEDREVHDLEPLPRERRDVAREPRGIRRPQIDRSDVPGERRRPGATTAGRGGRSVVVHGIDLVRLVESGPPKRLARSRLGSRDLDPTAHGRSATTGGTRRRALPPRCRVATLRRASGSRTTPASSPRAATVPSVSNARSAPSAGTTYRAWICGPLTSSARSAVARG